MRKTICGILACVVVLGVGAIGRCASPDPFLQAKIDAKLSVIRAWAADPVVVEAVREQNQALPVGYAAMTQEEWRRLPVSSQFVRDLTRTPAGLYMSSVKTMEVSEVFISDAAGVKVGFLGKPTYWSHKGKPKHEVPMSGEVWQGPEEEDESSGMRQIQVSVPIWDAGKPIGSLVVGLNVHKL